MATKSHGSQMDEHRSGVCCECKCITTKCQYRWAIPPIILDNIYNRFRSPYLGVVCIIIILVFGSTNIYNLSSLPCDEKYVVDPVCQQSAVFRVPSGDTIVNMTRTTLQSQNNVNNAWRTSVDKISTILLCIGNSPYHSPFYLLFGFIGTSYSTMDYTSNTRYCGDTCKTPENHVFDLPEECNPFIAQNGLCSSDHHDDSYQLCIKCQCLHMATVSCMQYVHVDKSKLMPFITKTVRRFTIFIYSIIFYFRQILALYLMLKILYEYIYSKKKNIGNDYNRMSDEPPIGRYRSHLTKWKSVANNVFGNPLSVRLSAGSFICIMFLVVSWCIWYNVLLIPLQMLDGLKHFEWVNPLVSFLVWLDGILCTFIYLRCVRMMHTRFQSDVAAVYSYFDGLDFNSVPQMNMSQDSQRTKSKNIASLIFHSLFPNHTSNGTHIVEHVKKTRIMDAYKFIFVYPFCMVLGINLLFCLAALIPAIPITLIVLLIIYKQFELLEELLTWVITKGFIICAPLIMVWIVDRCVLKGNTSELLQRRHIRCFWYITWIDALATFGSAMAVGLFSVVFSRIGYALVFNIVGLLTPYRSGLPHPFEMMDSVYNSYCANVALAVLSLLRANEEKLSDDVLKLSQINSLLQKKASRESAQSFLDDT
eukprot:381136_1